jgi:ornithine carbamoyltransferase/carbamoyltransferase
VGILFTKTSTRTRTAFTAGTVRLGGIPITYGPADLQTATGESLADTGRVFGAMLDVLVVRTAGPHAELVELATAAEIPVINAMTAEEHPTQALCDLATLAAHGLLRGVRLLYVGDGNNTAVALAYGLALVEGAVVTFATPPGYGLPGDVLARAGARAARAGVDGAVLSEVHDMTALPRDVDVVYTTRWLTTGTTKPDAAWRETFDPFRIRPALMARWPGAWFMHDLPAHRGEEVVGEVLDGPHSLAWSQAEMKMYSAMALLERAATGRVPS